MKRMFVFIGFVCLVGFNCHVAIGQELLWSHDYGGSSAEQGNDVIQATDGGYIITGETGTFGDLYQNMWVIKTDPAGDLLWTKSFGNSQVQRGNAIGRMPDGGYIVVGVSHIFEETFTADLFIVRLDQNGDALWERTYEQVGEDVANDVVVEYEGSFVVAGYTTANGPNGGGDVYLVKFDGSGNILWQQYYGSADNPEQGVSMTQTFDGGYVIAGTVGPFGGSDIYVVRTDADGNELWSNTFGGDQDERGNAIVAAPDGGYAILGYTKSYGAGDWDFYLVKIDVDGNQEWDQTYGGVDVDYGFAIQTTADGGYILAGHVGRFSYNPYLVKTDVNGLVEWDGQFGTYNDEKLFSVALSNDGGFLAVGLTGELGPNILALKIGADQPLIDCGDVNGDGSMNVADAVYIINNIFKSGPAPTCQ